MAQVREDMSELKLIMAELKITNAKAKELRTRKKELETQLLEYLDETESPGLKFQELEVRRTETVTHARMKKQDKKLNIVQVLEEKGVENAEEVYKAIVAAGVGEAATQQKLRIKHTLPEIV